MQQGEEYDDNAIMMGWAVLKVIKVKWCKKKM